MQLYAMLKLNFSGECQAGHFINLSKYLLVSLLRMFKLNLTSKKENFFCRKKLFCSDFQNWERCFLLGCRVSFGESSKWYSQQLDQLMVALAHLIMHVILKPFTFEHV